MLPAQIAVVSCPFPIDAAELPREHIGNRLFARDAVLSQDNGIRFYTLSNIRFGHGQGEDFSQWHRTAGTRDWEISPVPLPEKHMPGMISKLRLDDETTLYLYVDRRDAEHLYLQRVDGDGAMQTLFDLPRGGEFKRFLNPHMDRMPDGRIHVLLPDRNDVVVRRFIVDPVTKARERLPDIRMPRTGARIYDRLVVGTRLFIPVSVIDEMFILAVDLDDYSVEMHSIDRFSSPSGEPPRNTSIFRLQATGEFVLFYLRPARFSDRTGRHGPPTGLAGEHVCTVVCAETFRVKNSTVIAGLKAEAAATHNRAVARIGEQEFLFAHTEVDRIHQRHLTGAYENYVGSFLTRWKIDQDGTTVELGRREIPPMSFFTVASNGKGDAILLCNEARQDDPLFMYRFDAVDIRGNVNDRQMLDKASEGDEQLERLHAGADERHRHGRGPDRQHRHGDHVPGTVKN